MKKREGVVLDWHHQRVVNAENVGHTSVTATTQVQISEHRKPARLSLTVIEARPTDEPGLHCLNRGLAESAKHQPCQRPTHKTARQKKNKQANLIIELARTRPSTHTPRWASAAASTSGVFPPLPVFDTAGNTVAHGRESKASGTLGQK